MTTLDELRNYATARSLFEPVSLVRAIERLGFLQADPIRAPARAQDLTLRLRALDYRAGDLEARYSELAVEEDFFVNYGFVPRAVQAWMHPRTPRKEWTPETTRRAKALLAFVHERAPVHPREATSHFAHGSVTNYWGGSSNATTHLLDNMHYCGLLRVVRRDHGVRVYGIREPTPPAASASERALRLDALVDLIVAKYAPLPALSFNALLSRLRYATPQWSSELKAANQRAKQRLAHAHVNGVTWYWPLGEAPADAAPPDDRVRLLAPFDPVVWDRRRFELFWSWPYRFEAYTPAAKRRFGYYALPLLWRGKVLGWANLSIKNGILTSELGYVSGSAPRDRVFKRELTLELERMRDFLGL